ncbi:hypothetical protein PsYK624_115500 [Phanerochaete sordida]|uniref:Uncharacterized protein n=1 Tax=Phanerochaete sordida TaxID=48140 RepID=A0A9P3LHB5_9APHY|nr:hypothetical protein PsYK624_115500 [Phanerochaete sordida]
MFITRPPVDAEWARFQHHARRVRELCENECAEFDADKFSDAEEEQALNIIRKSCPRPVFPQLRSLFVSVSGRRPHHIWTLRCETLESLTIHLSRLDSTSERILRALPQVVPCLTEVVLVYADGPYFESTETRYFEMFLPLRHLRNLRQLTGTKHPLPLDLIVHLSRADPFNDIELAISPSNIRLWDCPNIGRFLSLSRLTIKFVEHTYPSEWAAFLCALSAAPLQFISLSFHLSKGHRTATLPPLFHALGQFRLLKDCTVSDDSKTAWPWDGEPLSVSSLRPLLQVRSIERFMLHNLPLKTSTPFCEELATALPRLEMLDVSNRDQQLLPEHSMPLEDLAHLVARCPRLEDVAVYCAPIPAGWSFTDPYPDAPSSRLACLTVKTDDMPSEAESQVCALFIRYFPNASQSSDRCYCLHDVVVWPGSIEAYQSYMTMVYQEMEDDERRREEADEEDWYDQRRRQGYWM